MEWLNTKYDAVDKTLNKIYGKVGVFLEKNDTAYKIVLITIHLFRMISMYALMVCLSLPVVATLPLMISATLLYRAAIEEKKCSIRFTIPSMAGAGTLWLARTPLLNFVAGLALTSLKSAITNTLSLAPLVGYAVWIVYQSHRDIEKDILERLKNSCKKCN